MKAILLISVFMVTSAISACLALGVLIHKSNTKSLVETGVKQGGEHAPKGLM